MHDMEANLHHPDLKPRKAINTSSAEAFAAAFDPDLLGDYTSHWGLLHASERRVRRDRIRGLIMQMRCSSSHKEHCLDTLAAWFDVASDYYRSEGEGRRKVIDKELLAKRKKERMDFDRPGRPTSLIRDLGWADRIRACLEEVLALEEAEIEDADDPSIQPDLSALGMRLSALGGSVTYRAKRLARSNKDGLLKAARDEARKLKIELATLKAERAQVGEEGNRT